MKSVFGKDDEPSQIEKTNQLERIALSQTFDRLEKPAKLLSRLVNDSLADIEPTEHQLGIDLFERPIDWETDLDNIVRQNLTRLRKLLETYYATEGIEDRLNLELSGRKTLFSYNPRHPFERVFQGALRHVATRPSVAFSLLDAALGIDPHHAEALAARGETELLRLMIGDGASVTDLMEAAEGQAHQALRFDNRCWRGHVVLGAVHSCRNNWAAAGKQFALALKSSPTRTESHPWYAAHLMAMGRAEEALKLVRARASAPSSEPWAQLTYAVFLYAARKFDEAQSVVLEAKKRYEDTWLSHVIWSCILSAQKRQKTSVPLLGMSLLQSLPDGTVVYASLSLFEHLWRLERDSPDYAVIQGVIEEWLIVKEAAMTATDEPPPFTEPRVAPFQLAIAYMAINQHDKALDWIRQDVKRGHPLMAWLHLWPRFDSLREMTGFKELIARMKLPPKKRT